MQEPTQNVMLGSLQICPIICGMWQVAGGHGSIDPERAVAAMATHLAAGMNTFDMADIYGPAESIFGAFAELQQTAAAAQGQSSHPTTPPPRPVVGLTKFVPSPGSMTLRAVTAGIDRSRAAMKVDVLDLVQFHWWDYSDERYLDAGKALMQLKAAGKIRHLGLTNFDMEHMRKFVDSGVEVVSNQVSYSLIDRRPEVHMTSYCVATGIKLLTYGTLLGGLLSERYLGTSKPTRTELNTASLRKYFLFVEEWGGWEMFQTLLTECDAIARKHSVSIANVSIRWVLDQPAVAGVIVGARLGVSSHVRDNMRALDLKLDAEDHARLNAASSAGRMLRGDCGDEYR